MICDTMPTNAADEFSRFIAGRKFKTILADPPWQFQNKTGKVAPEHKRLARYSTLKLDEIKALPVESAATDTAHLYLWVPNALLPEGLAVMEAWGFKYKSNIVWQKVRKDGGAGRTWCRFLLSKRDRAFAVWCSRKECTNLATRTHASEYDRNAQT